VSAAAEPAGRHRRDVIVIGASAGGVEALTTIAGGLPADLEAAVFVVLHVGSDSPSLLAGILARAGPLPVSVAVDRAPVRPGTICVAPPGAHLALGPDVVRVLQGPKANGHRPAIDVLFHSAARAYGPRVAGVVLTGALHDGTLGLRSIKRRGGAAIVQSDAVHQGMPTSAIENVSVDAVLPLREIPGMLMGLASADEEEEQTDEREPVETDVESGFDLMQVDEPPGSPTFLRCPECNGSLWELEDGELRSYACHVGHVFSADSLVEEQRDAVERALWTAVRLLQEQAALSVRLADRLDRGDGRSAGRFRSRAAFAERQAEIIRREVLTAPDADEPEERGSG
jgi:two-component system chemotaxis response regulator CheB